MQQFPLWLLITSFALYVALMFFISYLTSRKMGANSFFSGDRKAPWFVVAYGVIELFLGVTQTGSNIAHFAHVGGMLFGFVLLLLWKRSGKIYY